MWLIRLIKTNLGRDLTSLLFKLDALPSQRPNQIIYQVGSIWTMSLLINSKDIYIPNNMCYKFALSKSRMPRTYHGATNSRLQLLYDPQKRFGWAGLFYFLLFGWWGYRHGTNRRVELNTRPWRANPTLVPMTQHCDGNVLCGSESIWACLLAQCQQISCSKIL